VKTITMNDLQQQIAQLTQRIDRLESELVEVRGLALEGMALDVPSETSQASRSLSLDVVMAISAAVAAYLGKRAVIRQVQLASDTAWTMQGRMAVQASHDTMHGFR
jgi:methylmalonyl-CoA carboxyltransferase 12S subunit